MMRWQWNVRRAAIDRAGLLPRFSGRSDLQKVLMLGERGNIAEAQRFAFWLYERELADRYRVEIRELPLHLFLSGHNPFDRVDAVCLQTWFSLQPAELFDLVQRIKTTWPNAPLAYFDWFAPADLRFAEVLNSEISGYIKKQVFKNFCSYNQPTVGDTNLTDFYAKRFGIDMPSVVFAVPREFNRKIVLGPGFECTPDTIENLKHSPTFKDRPIDLHARMAVKGSPWYSAMREEAISKVTALANRVDVVYKGRVSATRFMNELRNSKLCFSPFGYGEVCWRDFEAMSTGALLLKQDVSHLRLARDFFRPHDTYVPLAWDLSDLEEKIDYYLGHEKEREAIARNALNLLREYHDQKQFVFDISPLWRRLGLA
jgi:Glycosyl transferases group 1